MKFRNVISSLSIIFLFIVISQIAIAADECGDINLDGKVNITDFYLAMKLINDHGDLLTCPSGYSGRLDIGPLNRDAAGNLIKVNDEAQSIPDGQCNDLDLQVIEQIMLKKIELNCAP